MFLLVPVAAAADPSPTLLLPSAAPAPQGTAEVGLSFGHATVGLSSYDSRLGTSLRAGFAPSDEVWLEGVVGGDLFPSRSCGIFPGGSCSEPTVGGDGLLALSGRYRFALSEGFALAPVVGAMGTADQWGGWTVAGVGGVALEGGGRRVRGDLTLTLAVGGTEYGPGLFPVGEGGVSFLIGRERRHTIRVGVAELVPDVSWRYEGDRWFVGAGVTGVPLVLGGEHVTVGLRF